MSGKIFRRLAPAFGLVLLGLALAVLIRELKSFSLQEVIGYLRALPGDRLGLALLFAFGNYVVLTGYDALAFRYIRHPLAYPRIALTSFIGYAFSHNIGLTVLTNGSVRYRFYSSWGLSALDIARVVLFCGLTYWLGFLTLGGTVLATRAVALPSSFPLPAAVLPWLGVAFLSLAAAYLALSAGLRQRLVFRGREFTLPSLPVALGQVILSVLDWALAGGILYALLPPEAGLSYSGFLSVFLLAQTAGLVSQVPGGLGVFESVLLLMLNPVLPPSKVLGLLLAFRAIYYLLPFGAALALMGLHEIWSRRRGAGGGMKGTDKAEC